MNICGSGLSTKHWRNDKSDIYSFSLLVYSSMTTRGKEFEVELEVELEVNSDNIFLGKNLNYR